jgi:glutaredoxin
VKTIEVTLVTGQGCKPCEKVKELLRRFGPEFPELRVHEIDIGTDEGADLALRYRLGGLPGLLVNGRFAFVGDVSEEMLRRRLELARATLDA